MREALIMNDVDEFSDAITSGRVGVFKRQRAEVPE